MCISRARYEEIERHGHDGITGQALADQWERKIRKSGSAENPFADFNPGYGASGSPYVMRDRQYNAEEEDDDNG